MTPTYRVRYSLSPAGGPPKPGDVLTMDIAGDLATIPGKLPPGAYIMYVEDWVTGQTIHWTRWPHAYRPGFGGHPASVPS